MNFLEELLKMLPCEVRRNRKVYKLNISKYNDGDDHLTVAYSRMGKNGQEDVLIKRDEKMDNAGSRKAVRSVIRDLVNEVFTVDSKEKVA